MQKTPVIVIFDIGKTNKKFFLFNEQYKIEQELTIQFDEITDEDGDACENLAQLSSWIHQMLNAALQQAQFDIKAISFSTYGASFVHIDQEGDPLTPLYNYLKPFPKKLEQQLYDAYGGKLKVSVETASPVLGNLNSGLQLYKLKQERPDVFQKITWSLHLPQYISYLVTGKAWSDITSIGCHTALWHFEKRDYHEWVVQEHILPKLPPLFPSNATMDVNVDGKALKAGAGLHDSSAALIPYLSSFKEPFVLISTGTWCISLNPFNHYPLTINELQQDCLCYLSYEGTPVKASRLFAGYEHEQEVKRLAERFNVPVDHYRQVRFDPVFLNEDPPSDSYEAAYHQFMAGIINRQVESTQLVIKGTEVKRIFVDGGFGKNPVYMNLLALAFPGVEVYAASMAQASAMGAALAIHAHWNTQPLPADLIDLRYYACTQKRIT